MERAVAYKSQINHNLSNRLAIANIMGESCQVVGMHDLPTVAVPCPDMIYCCKNKRKELLYHEHRASAPVDRFI